MPRTVTRAVIGSSTPRFQSVNTFSSFPVQLFYLAIIFHSNVVGVLEVCLELPSGLKDQFGFVPGVSTCPAAGRS